MSSDAISRFKVPLRLSLAGGGTDVEPFASTIGSTVANFAINKYLKIEIYQHKKEREDYFHITLIHADNSFETKQNSLFVMKLADAFNARFSPPENIEFDIRVTLPVAKGSGLGASSALISGLIYATRVLHNNEVDLHDIARLSFEFERKDMGIAGGFQDYYPALFGGFNIIEQKQGESKQTMERLQINDSFSDFIASSLFCFSLDRSISGDKIIADQVMHTQNNQSDSFKAQVELGSYTKPIILSILEENYDELLHLLDLAYAAKKRFSPLIVTKQMEEMEHKLRQIGARGIKISGAGGGGHMFCFFTEGIPSGVSELLPLGSIHFPVNISMLGAHHDEEN